MNIEKNKKRNTLLVTGSYPPDVCGVGDYSYNLMHASNAKNWSLFYKRDWRIINYFKYIRQIENGEPNKIIIQYPTQGYGWSLLPLFLAIYFTKTMGNRCILVYHEFSNRSKKAKIIQDIALKFVKNIVVTNDFEKQYIEKKHKSIKINVIKIYSNICKANDVFCFSKRKIDYCYFGQIRPQKGIEEYINFIKATKRKNNSIIIGMIPDQFKEYGKRIIKIAQKVGINIFLNLDNIHVAQVLSNSKSLLHFFPDGLSERRGSFMAGAINGCLIISTVGKYTSPELMKCIYRTLPDTVEKIDAALMNCNDNEWHKYYDAVKTYFRKNVPRSWEEIVDKYNIL